MFIKFVGLEVLFDDRKGFPLIDFGLEFPQEHERSFDYTFGENE